MNRSSEQRRAGIARLMGEPHDLLVIGGGTWMCAIEDHLTGTQHEIRARTIVNATGPWADRPPPRRHVRPVPHGGRAVAGHGGSDFVQRHPARALHPRAVAHYVHHEWAVQLDDVMQRRSGWHYCERESAARREQVAAWMAGVAS